MQRSQDVLVLRTIYSPAEIIHPWSEATRCVYIVALLEIVFSREARCMRGVQLGCDSECRQLFSRVFQRQNLNIAFQGHEHSASPFLYSCYDLQSALRRFLNVFRVMQSDAKCDSIVTQHS